MLSDLYCIALVVPNTENRFFTYAQFYAEMLMKLGKKVVVLCPDFDEMEFTLRRNVPKFANNVLCRPIDSKEFEDKKSSIINTIGRWNYVSKQIQLAEKGIDAKVEFVLFCPIDNMLRNSVNLSLLNWNFNYKWSGLYLNPEPYKLNQLKLNVDPKFSDPDYLFRSENCVGVCILDRFILDSVRSRVYKKVVVFPELSNLSLSNNGMQYPQEIHKQARGRVIVGLLGVEKNEGILALIRLIKLVDQEKYFFVFAGKIDMSEFDETQREEIESFIQLNQDNALFIIKELSEEEINTLYKSIDISYLYFYNYISSNNMLTKAAHFNKPVLANKNYCVGQTVKQFKIGLSVNGKIEESVQALEFMSLDSMSFRIFDKSNFERYTELQNEDYLEMAFEQITQF